MGNKLLHSSKGGRRSSGLLTDGPRMASFSLSLMKARAKGVASSPNGDLYVVYGHAILVLDSFRNITTQYGDIGNQGFVDGVPQKSRFFHPHGMRFLDHRLLICDRQNHVIRSIENGAVVTFAGSGDEGFHDGPLSVATFCHPVDLASLQSTLYVSTSGQIRIITADNMVSTLKLDETSHEMRNKGLFRSGYGICARNDGVLFISHTSHQPHPSNPEVHPYVVSRVDLKTKEVRQLNKGDKNDHTSQWEKPSGLCLTDKGELIVCEHSQNTLILMDTDTYKCRPLLRGMSKAHDFVYQMSRQMAAKSAFDGPLQRAWTIDPIFITLTAHGDLVWTESGSNKVRYIAGFQTPTGGSHLSPTLLNDATSNSDNSEHLHRATMSSYEDLLEHPRFQDFIIKLKPSSTTFKLSRSLISVAAPQLLSQSAKKKFARCGIPSEIMRQFFSLLYGSPSIPTFNASKTIDDDCLDIARLLHLAFIAGVERDHKVSWVAQLESRLCSLLFSNPAEVAQRLMDKVVSELDSQESILQILYLALEKHGLQTDLPAANAGISPKSRRRFAPQLQLDLKQVEDENMKISAIQLSLAELSKKIDFISASVHVDQAALPGNPNFRISIEKRELSIFVHDWVLFKGWPYFTDVMNAGLQESRADHLELPEHFSPSVLLAVIRYVYSSGEDFGFLTKEDCFWIIQHGAQFGLINLDYSSPLAFSGFVKFIEWTLLAPMTVDNALDTLRARLLMKRTKELDQSVEFILANYPHYRDSRYLQMQMERFVNENDSTEPHVVAVTLMLNAILAGDTTPRRIPA